MQIVIHSMLEILHFLQFLGDLDAEYPQVVEEEGNKGSYLNMY